MIKMVIIQQNLHVNKINYLDKRIKKNDRLGNVDEMTKLLRERELLTNKLKTKLEYNQPDDLSVIVNGHRYKVI